MSDVDLSLSSLHTPDHGLPKSGGALLRQAREASGLSVSALASLLKVSTSKLDALESNRGTCCLISFLQELWLLVFVEP